MLLELYLLPFLLDDDLQLRTQWNSACKSEIFSSRQERNDQWRESHLKVLFECVSRKF